MAKTIWVSLNTSKNPQVHVDNRDKQADAGEIITWKKKDNDDNFEISSLVPAGPDTAFLNPVLNKRRTKLECKFCPDERDIYPYTLTVTVEELGGLKQYDTTADIQSCTGVMLNSGGRPVIRN